MWDIELTKQAVKDLKRVREAGFGKKVHTLIEIVQQNPFSSTPPFETLKGNLSGCYSRRINWQHRFVYEVYQEPHKRGGVHYEGTVRILRMWTHYEGLGHQ